MKILKAVKIALILLIVLFTANVFAQKSATKTVPEQVILALKQKYSNANTKSWQIKGDSFTAKIIIGGKKCFVTFDENGNWINTASKISWPWGLPATIRTAYKKSDYGAWNIYVSKKIESPAGEFYELMVDNSEIFNTSPPQYFIPSDKLLKFKADGELASVSDISNNPTLKF